MTSSASLRSMPFGCLHLRASPGSRTPPKNGTENQSGPPHGIVRWSRSGVLPVDLLQAGIGRRELRGNGVPEHLDGDDHDDRDECDQEDVFDEVGSTLIALTKLKPRRNPRLE